MNLENVISKGAEGMEELSKLIGEAGNLSTEEMSEMLESATECPACGGELTSVAGKNICPTCVPTQRLLRNNAERNNFLITTMTMLLEAKKDPSIDLPKISGGRLIKMALPTHLHNIDLATIKKEVASGTCTRLSAAERELFKRAMSAASMLELIRLDRRLAEDQIEGFE